MLARAAPHLVPQACHDELLQRPGDAEDAEYDFSSCCDDVLM